MLNHYSAVSNDGSAEEDRGAMIRRECLPFMYSDTVLRRYIDNFRLKSSVSALPVPQICVTGSCCGRHSSLIVKGIIL